MTITNFTQLKTQIGVFLDRTDLTSVIPIFVQMAEARMNREIRHWRMEKRSTATFNEQYEGLPLDWIETIRVNIQNDRQLELASHAEIAERRRQTNDTPGKPYLYAHAAGNLEFYPTPDAAYTGEIVYCAKLIPLTADIDTNWVLRYAPDAYLYGSLLHSAPYLKDDPRIDVWAALYRSAVDALNAERSQWSGTGLRLRRRGLG